MDPKRFKLCSRHSGIGKAALLPAVVVVVVVVVVVAVASAGVFVGQWLSL